MAGRHCISSACPFFMYFSWYSVTLCPGMATDVISDYIYICRRVNCVDEVERTMVFNDGTRVALDEVVDISSEQLR